MVNEHPFLFIHDHISSVKYLIVSSSIFRLDCLRFFVCLLFSFENSFNILNTSILLDIWLANILYPLHSVSHRKSS
jgi:hypothetical protein